MGMAEIQCDLVVEAPKAFYCKLLQHHVHRTPQIKSIHIHADTMRRCGPSLAFCINPTLARKAPLNVPSLGTLGFSCMRHYTAHMSTTAVSLKTNSPTSKSTISHMSELPRRALAAVPCVAGTILPQAKRMAAILSGMRWRTNGCETTKAIRSVHGYFSRG